MDTHAAMEMALRVLTAASERKIPDENDVQELKRLVPTSSHLPADEMACEVICMIREKKKGRAKEAGK